MTQVNRFLTIVLTVACDKHSTGKKIEKVKFIPANEYRISDISTIFSNKYPPDIAVFEMVYCPEFCKISKQLKKLNIPYVIIPRGSLCSVAQSTKKAKKIVGNLLMFNSFMMNAAAIQYLTKREYTDSGDKWNKKHLIIPNGIIIPEDVSKKTVSDGYRGTFIGRLDITHKGLDLLLEAVSQVKEMLIEKKCVINIYGADSVGDKEKLIAMVENLNVRDVVYINEPVYGDEKRHVLENSDFFILTSRYEGHPMGLIEAMSYGIPAIVTYGSNMGEEIEEADAGWVCNENAGEIKEKLLELLSNEAELNRKGNNSLELARKYKWSEIAETTCKSYMEIVNG